MRQSVSILLLAVAGIVGCGVGSVAPVVTDNTGGTNIGPQNVARVILFDYDSYVIKAEYQNIVEAHARWMKANPTRKLNIEGHTDERGGREYNLALGQRRAEAVRAFLANYGIDPDRFTTVSFGKERPLVEGEDEEAWARNRRAEFALAGGQVTVVPEELR